MFNPGDIVVSKLTGLKARVSHVNNKTTMQVNYPHPFAKGGYSHIGNTVLIKNFYKEAT